MIQGIFSLLLGVLGCVAKLRVKRSGHIFPVNVLI